MNWRTDYTKARAEAQKIRRPIFLMCSEKGCRSSTMLSEAIAEDAELVAVLNDRMIPILLSGDDHQALFRALHVTAFPTIFLAADDGKVLASFAGTREPEKFTRKIREVLKEIDLR